MSKILNEIKKKADPNRAKNLSWFFKTGKGEYGEGDLFLGITVPEARKIAIKYSDLNLNEIQKLLKNKYHEVRLVAILILVHKFKSSDKKTQKIIYKFYLKNTKHINNWDLVDLSTGYIVGIYLLDKKSERKVLEKLAKSKSLWERRIAIVSTLAFIVYGKEFKWTFKIVKMLLKDENDLIHKACGWMLREVGKRVSESQLEAFLDVYGPKMARTMLRYAIERLPEPRRQYYLNK
jgi:3-methyladenine DNA glycosylase AlkD